MIRRGKHNMYEREEINKIKGRNGKNTRERRSACMDCVFSLSKIQENKVI